MVVVDNEKAELLKTYKAVTLNLEKLVIAAARKRLMNYARYMQPDFILRPFNEAYYEVLDRFAHKKIKKLIVSMPPQHGKSQGSSRFLPSFMLGLNPDQKITIGSYAASVARDFNRDNQRIIDTPRYRKVFPDTFLNGSNSVTMANTYLRNSDVIEMVGRKGYLRVVGRGGALTSKTVDVSILDDVYKDYAEGNSPVIREAAWKWYTSVVRTRLHNDSQELIVFTRWNEDDLIGRLEEIEQVIDINSWSDLDNIPPGAWVRVNFQAIKENPKTELDPREQNTALWEDRHSLFKLQGQRALDANMFECLQQGNPGSSEGLLYQTFKTYTNNREEYGRFIRRGNYTDCADEGNDFLTSICYDIHQSENTFYDEKTRRHIPIVYALVTDIVFTDKPIEYTTVAVPEMLNRNGTEYANVESNNGGKAFSVIIRPKTRTRIDWFYQSDNKESRIITNAGLVCLHIIMPFDWQTRFPDFYAHVTKFLRDFKANSFDDAADALTGIIEKEILSAANKRGPKRIN